MQSKSKHTKLFWILIILAIGACLLYFWPITHLSAFAWKLRSQKIVVYLLVAIATGISTISFQTLTENPILLRPTANSTTGFWKQASSAWQVSYFRIPNLTSRPIPLLSRLTRLLEDTDEARPGLHPTNLSSTRKSLSKYQYLPPSPDGSKWIR